MNTPPLIPRAARPARHPSIWAQLAGMMWRVTSGTPSARGSSGTGLSESCGKPVFRPSPLHTFFHLSWKGKAKRKKEERDRITSPLVQIKANAFGWERKALNGKHVTSELARWLRAQSFGFSHFTAERRVEDESERGLPFVWITNGPAWGKGVKALIACVNPLLRSAYILTPMFLARKR